jgi:hypothetical protein
VFVHRGKITQLLRATLGRFQAGKIIYERNRSLSAMLLRLAAPGALAAGMVVLRLLDAVPEWSAAAALPEWAVEWALPTTMVALLAITVFQRLLLGAVGSVTRSRDFMDSLLRLRRAVFYACAVVATPIFLLVASSEVEWAAAALFPLVAAWLLLLLYKTFKLFADQKISILHWFLYLCTVEIFPPSLVALLAVRNI